MFDRRHPSTSASVLHLADDVTRTVRIARALAEASRAVDISGLDASIDLLCARVLDLDPEDGSRFRPRLLALRAEIDLLETILRAAGVPGAADERVATACAR